MRYDLGLMDMYPIEASGTIIENDPMFKIVMKEEVDPIKLEDSVYRAIKFHPLFGTQVGYDGSYYLETNNRPVKIIHADEANRPLEFCKGTNGYPWQICWWENSITFEWCHGVTDGMGALDFIRTMLCAYCGMEFEKIPRKIMLGPGLEPFVDQKERGVNFNIQPKGFSTSAMPIYDRGYETDCHVLQGSTQEILSVSRANESCPSAVLAVLLSRALRSYIPEKVRNRNVACNVVMDLRRPLRYETMHNCVEYKRITYQDKHDGMSIGDISREYKQVLDNARIRENVVRLITERVNLFKAYHLVKNKKRRKQVLGLIGKFMKDSDCNCVLTYLGDVRFPEKVAAHIEDIQVRCWHDFGECCMACLDFNGVFTINICENYIKKGVVAKFIELCEEEGIHLVEKETFKFEQRHFVEEDVAIA